MQCPWRPLRNYPRTWLHKQLWCILMFWFKTSCSLCCTDCQWMSYCNSRWWLSAIMSIGFRARLFMKWSAHPIKSDRMGIFHFPLINYCCLEKCRVITTLLLFLPFGILSSQKFVGLQPCYPLEKFLKTGFSSRPEAKWFVILTSRGWMIGIWVYYLSPTPTRYPALLCMFYMFLKSIYVCCLEFSD